MQPTLTTPFVLRSGARSIFSLALFLAVASPATLSAQSSNNPCRKPLAASPSELVDHTSSSLTQRPGSCDSNGFSHAGELQSRSNPSSSGQSSSTPSPNQQSPSPTGVRILGEFAGSIIGAGVGMGIGALAGIEYADNHPDADRAGWIRFSAGAGALLGGPFGAFAGGDLLHGRGQISPTYLGGLGGTILGLSLAGTQDSVGGQLAFIGGGNIVGAIIGYEISHLIKRSNSGNPSASIAPLRPTVSVHPTSGTPLLTIFGTF